MNEHVWRIPTVLGVMACSALVLFAAGVVGSALTRRPQSVSSRLAMTTVLSLLALITAVGLRVTVTLVARTHDISVRYVDPGPIGYVAPAMFAGFAFVVAKGMLRDAWTSPSALLFYAWLLGFTAANIINRCQPGWCGTIGFPFTWQSWSDVFLSDGGFRRLMEVVGAVLNLVTFVAVAGVLTRIRVPRRSA